MHTHTDTHHIAVIIPAYNAARTLPATLDALAGQTYARGRVTVVVVDDGSTDDTAVVAARHGVVCLRQRNQGPAAARNAGAAAPEAREAAVVVFTDADCVPEPDFLETLVAPLVADAGLSGAQGAYITRQTALVARFAQLEFEDRYAFAARFPGLDLVATYAAAYRREVFCEAGGFSCDFTRADNEDTELSYRLCAAGHRFVFVPGAKVAHRHPATLRKYLRIKASRAYWRLRACREHPEKLVRDGYTPGVIRVQTALAGGLVLGLAALPLTTAGGMVALGCTLGVIVSGRPFRRFAARRDPAVARVAPVLVLARSLAFALGAGVGVGRGFVDRLRGRGGKPCA